MRDFSYIEQWLQGEEDTQSRSSTDHDFEKIQFWQEVTLLELGATKKRPTIRQRVRSLIKPPPVERFPALAMLYNGECVTLTPKSTPDPFVVKAHRRYYMTYTAVVWTPPPSTEHSADLWAPELHAIRGRWYIYYAAANPARGNESHRMYVLGGPSATDDPTQGQWEFLGRIHGMPDQWAIDGTVFELNNALYFVYSGWPLDDHSNSDLTQQLFIMKLEDPTMAGSEPVMISAPEHPWEFTTDNNGAHGINEGPQFLKSPDGSWKGIVYSAAGSWTPRYKLAVLHYNGGDPLNPRSWPKGQQPLLESSGHDKGPWGPGHGSFINIGDETLCIFHGTDREDEGWENRKARCQRVMFTEVGPYMGHTCGHAESEKQPKKGLVDKLRRRLSKQKDEIVPDKKANSLKAPAPAGPSMVSQ
ncbi:hypothetical protein TruAng_000823 [Truncatella angustata]|nr:hypothetical protein TruAng_000823 [Truncatella angustata]